MKTESKLHGEARKSILRGVNAVADAVRLTLGHEGSSVLLHRSFNRGARITNDGVTVAQCVEPKDAFENLVATSFKEGAKKTGEKAGDGTTSTIVISAKLINDAFSLFPDVANESVQFAGVESSKIGSNSLRKHIMSCVPKIKEAIQKQTKKVKTKEELENIIDVSMAGNRDVSKILTELVWKGGTDAFITLEDGFKGIIEVEPVMGARFPMKVAANVFINKQDRYVMEAEDCEVIVTNYGITTIMDFFALWNAINPGVLNVHKLIIFAPSFGDPVLGKMLDIVAPEQPDRSRRLSGVQIFPVKCPSLGSEDRTPHNFQDLADYCDARFIDKNKGDKLKDIKKLDLGFLEKCTVYAVEDRQDAELLGGRGEKSEKTKKRIEDLKSQIQLTKLPEHRALIEKRISSLLAVGGKIKVGAPTEAEALPLKHKIEDAISAGKMALRHGYVKGGGLCLKEIADELFADDQMIHDALYAPYNQIQLNCGGNVKVGKDILDPSHVVQLEVEHGFGVAANLITVKAIIPEYDEHDPKDSNKGIADAIMTGVMYWAKQNGLYQSGIKEASVEALQKQEAMIQRELGD